MQMARLCLVSVVCFLALRSAIGATITVGDSLGWTNFDVATQRVPDYAAWATSQPVAPGDSVAFKYAPGFHNVALLPSKADFDACNFAKSTILDIGSSGSFTWKAPQKTGVYYFACGVSVEGQGTHCDAGQKVSISITATGEAPSAPSAGASPTAPVSAAPPPASSLLAPSASPAASPPAAPKSESAPAPETIPVLPPGITPASGADGIAPGTLPTTTISPSAAAAPLASEPSGVARLQVWSWIIVLPCALTVTRFMS